MQKYTRQMISDEVLRYRIRRIIGEPKSSRWWKRIWTNQLFFLIVGFILTGVLGTYLTNYYNAKQKERESDRSFADELNKIRLNKIAEVWEKVYVYEAAVEEVMQGVKVKSDSHGQGEIEISSKQTLKKALEQSKDLKKQLLYVLNKNRVWLEDDNYYKIKEYADVIYEYYFSMQTEMEMEKWKEKRDQAIASLNEIREKMWRR